MLLRIVTSLTDSFLIVHENVIVSPGRTVALNATLHFASEYFVVHFGDVAVRQILPPVPVLVLFIVTFREIHDRDRGQYFVLRIILFDDNRIVRRFARTVFERLVDIKFQMCAVRTLPRNELVFLMRPR